jgi:hypothetical protein
MRAASREIIVLMPPTSIGSLLEIEVNANAVFFVWCGYACSTPVFRAFAGKWTDFCAVRTGFRVPTRRNLHCSSAP